jgi:hypothetical protein
MADESEEGAVTYKLTKFTETDKVNFILDSIPEACKTITKTERALQDLRGNFVFLIDHFSVQICQNLTIVNVYIIIIFIAEILDRYQEQPHLLDPYLGNV